MRGVHWVSELRELPYPPGIVPPRERTVLCHGVFDLLHLGHIRHLQEARKLGDRLVVSVTNDPHVRKGSGRPWFTVEQRVEALRALDCVDEVVVSETADAVAVINQIRPAVYVKGADYDGRENQALQREIDAVTSFGGRFEVTRTDRWSSSRIINGERLDSETLTYLDRLRLSGAGDRILAAFEAADQLKLAFVGEAIIDEYRYVMPLGRPVKELCLATVESREAESFQGGVIAACKHAEWKHVTCVTNEHAALRKTRFVDDAFKRKLFEVYSERDIELNPQQHAALQLAIEEQIKVADVIVVLDFGHGLLGATERLMFERAKFLAVNSQTNTANFGFNRVTNYRQADLVCVDDPEARLATGLQNFPTAHVIMALARAIDCRNYLVTNGRNGSYSLRKDEPAPKHAPAFSTSGIDTMGAGDAFLAVAAPLVAAGLDLESAAFVGNVAGAIKVGILGHQRPVSRDELIQTIETLLK